MNNRHSLISSLLSPEQLSDFAKVKSALDKDPMCLEHHKVHVKDKSRTIPLEKKDEECI